MGAKENLTGYAGGIDKKIKLLELEGIDVNKFFISKSKNSF
ncbi:MAG: MGMT family protein [Muribaculaceae bacterium]